jgi:hypothetical protein
LPLDQEMHLAGWEEEQARCSQHGGPRSECADPDKPWYPHRTVCVSAMEAARANRRYDQLHKDLQYHDGTFTSWGKNPSAEHPYHFRDGVTISVTPVDLSPDDDFLSAQPEP